MEIYFWYNNKEFIWSLSSACSNSKFMHFYALCVSVVACNQLRINRPLDKRLGMCAVLWCVVSCFVVFLFVVWNRCSVWTARTLSHAHRRTYTYTRARTSRRARRSRIYSHTHARARADTHTHTHTTTHTRDTHTTHTHTTAHTHTHTTTHTHTQLHTHTELGWVFGELTVRASLLQPL